MTRNEARKAAEVMLAYVDGKEIECRDRHESQWREAKEPGFDWDYFEFRIKPQLKSRPFKDAEECWQEMQRHQPFGWVKDKVGEAYLIIGYVTATDVKDELPLIHTNEDDTYEQSSEQMFKHFTFADGTPFGVKEEE